ncbi:glycosyltransferase family 39 protein [Oscillatoria sp. FACHB-1406]|uniref:ArnT family glycosyltransferase n=1 Tax=Oscillatoria sp. FACHB-1406 TaxID=2692846 RepID=UPI0016847F4C|nr:glycosyltransferase family 39 protein [Oscillatoria sp. FACHB-1406]MBD2578403.1 glycosyltransferase family 39 protein [Oscillatoria sp. FACHB-1406]
MLRNAPEKVYSWLDSLQDYLEARSQLLNILVPFAFFILTLLWMPVRTNLSFDTDEGQELIKAILYSRGFALYHEIWSDQPPLLTICLSAWFKLFGASIFSGRLLVLCFATLLIWSFFKTLQISVGSPLALVGTGLLALSGNFLRMSVSVMIGLPALSLVTLSIYTLTLYFNSLSLSYLLLSGAAFAVSLQFKTFAVFLIPLILFFIFSNSLSTLKSPDASPSFIQKGRLRARKIKALNFKNKALKGTILSGLWLLAFVLTFCVIELTLGSWQLNSTFKFHVNENLKNVFVKENSILDVSWMLLQDFDLVLLAGLGVGTILQKKEKWNLFPLAWLATATLMLLNHKPLWYHHYLLLSIPLVWLASYGVKVAISEGQRLRKQAIIFCSLCAIAIPIKLGVIQWQNSIFLAESQEKTEVIRRVTQYQQQTHWLFTDNPIYAFQANLRVPPEIAVLSRKRVAAGEMTHDYLYALFEKYQPEQVILERFPEVYEPLKPYLEANYVKVEESGARRHFVKRSLLSKSFL